MSNNTNINTIKQSPEHKQQTSKLHTKRLTKQTERPTHFYIVSLGLIVELFTFFSLILTDLNIFENADFMEYFSVVLTRLSDVSQGSNFLNTIQYNFYYD